MRSTALVPLLALLMPGMCAAQAERYELGQRLKNFEAAWDDHPDAAARKRAVTAVGDVTRLFFTFRLGEAGRTLDEARFALASEPPPDPVRWATALYPDVPQRLVDGSSDLPVTLRTFYTPKGKRPDGLTVRLALGGGKPVTLSPDKLPAKVNVPLPPAGDVKRREDLKLTMDVLVDGKAVVTRSVGVSVIDGAEAAAAQLMADVKALGDKPTLESASVIDRAALLTELAKGTVPETDMPAAKRLAEARDMLAAVRAKQPYFTPKRPGDHWVSVPTGEKDRTPCRLFVPKGLDPAKPVPLVVAMHGAGGSENLFFEGYGAGHIVKLCEERGWLLVSPRAGLGFGLGGSVPVDEVIDRLAERYPIDPRAIFIVGHSMGASMTVDAVQKFPGKFAAAAALGGGGRVRKPDAFKTLPVFIGVGEQDFALRNAKALHKALSDEEAKAVTLKTYPDVEHLLIAREALGDVFALFGRIAKR